MMYLPGNTEWFFNRILDSDFYDVIVNGLATSCHAWDIDSAFDVLIGDDFDPYDDELPPESPLYFRRLITGDYRMVYGDDSLTVPAAALPDTLKALTGVHWFESPELGVMEATG